MICARFAIVVGYIDGYAREDTMARLQKIFDYVWVQDRPYANFPRLTPHVITPNQSFELGPFRVTPIDIRHGQREIFAYRFECENQTLVYATDCSQIPETSWPLFEGADVLIVGALRHKEHPTHFNIEQALEVVERIQPKRAFFTHIAHELGHEATNQMLPQNVALAFDNQRCDLREFGFRSLQAKNSAASTCSALSTQFYEFAIARGNCCHQRRRHSSGARYRAGMRAQGASVAITFHDSHEARASHIGRIARAQ